MNPETLSCLTAAGIDCRSLTNNHILDWGYAGLRETSATLLKAAIKIAGVGNNLKEEFEIKIPLARPQGGHY